MLACVSCSRAPCGHVRSPGSLEKRQVARLLEGHVTTHSAPQDLSERPRRSAARLPRGSWQTSVTHAFLLGWTLPSHVARPVPSPPALLGKEGFKGHQQAAGPQAVGESDASVHSCRRQAEELVRRVAELLHAVDDFPVLLVGKRGQRKAASGWSARNPEGGPRRHLHPAPSQGWQECSHHVGQRFPDLCHRSRLGGLRDVTT